MIFLADRTVRVRLIAEVADFKRQMGEATKAVDALPAGTAKAETGLGRLVQSAQYNREAWTTVGTAVGAVGVAILAVGVAALKTGISYNTLQQTSRAALTTLLGSAEAANAQMDKLDTFARTSPFSKQVFITAQQQLIGFGVAANKVIPALDAMQNAVAAMGGSNEQLSGIVGIFARIQSSAKITGEDLMEFGNRGIDAASLIGSQMGKTGAQIRQDITAGTLGAQDALTALTAGMAERFGGAAANVKNTFTGAVDRIKAAWRDFSGMIAEPLVGSEGGGVFVGLLNGAADTMRAFQALPDPIRNVSLGIIGLTGVAATLGGGFLVMAPRILETVKALKTMHLWTKAVGVGVGVAAGALTLAAIAFTIWSSAQANARARTEEFQATLDEFGKTTNDTLSRINDVLSSNQNDWAEGLLGKNPESLIDQAKKYGLAIEDLQGYILGEADATDRVTGATEEYYRSHGRLNTVSADVQAFTGALDDQAGALTGAEKAAAQKAAADEAAGVAAEGAAVAATGLADAVQYVGMSTEDATKALDDWRSMVSGSDASFISLTDGYQAVIDKNTAWAQATADSTESADDSWETYYDGVDVSVGDFIAQLQAQVDAQTAWETNMTALTTKAREGMTTEMATAADEMIAELMDLGPEGAAQVALMASMTDTEFQTVVTLWGQKGTAATAEFVAGVEAVAPPVIEVTADLSSAYSQVASFIRTANGLRIGLNAAGQQVEVRMPNGRIASAAGGQVFGPGTTTSDSIPALLSNREYVVKADAVDHYGPAFFDSLNAMRFASGGYVGSGSAAAARAPSLAGLAIEGTLDLGNGLVGVMRGVVKSELSSEASAVRARPRR